MRRIGALLILLLLFLLPAPALAQSLVGSSQECGVYTWHEDLTKGRTDGMVVHVYYEVEVRPGCVFGYDHTNLVGADREEMANNPKRERAWQMNECQRDGKEDTVNHFKWYRMMDINPDDVKVTCTPYKGPD